MPLRRDDTEDAEYRGSDGIEMSIGGRGSDDRSKNCWWWRTGTGVCWVSGRIVFATVAWTEQLGLLHQTLYVPAPTLFDVATALDYYFVFCFFSRLIALYVLGHFYSQFLLSFASFLTAPV